MGEAVSGETTKRLYRAFHLSKIPAAAQAHAEVQVKAYPSVKRERIPSGYSVTISTKPLQLMRPAT